MTRTLALIVDEARCGATHLGCTDTDGRPFACKLRPGHDGDHTDTDGDGDAVSWADQNLTSLTDEMINALPPTALHAAAAAWLDHYARVTTVATVQLTDSVLGHPGALTALDSFCAALREAYADRDPVVSTRYAAVEVQARQDDASLRDSLRYAARRAREGRDHH